MPYMYNYCPRVGELQRAIRRLAPKVSRQPWPDDKAWLEALRAELRTYKRSYKFCKPFANHPKRNG